MSDRDAQWHPSAQVLSDHYADYTLDPLRIENYMHQLLLIADCGAQSVLEVGAGPGLLATILRRHTDIELRTVDVAADVGADVVGSVHALPLCTGAFDVAVCCQVLEHLPFAQFPEALRELRRVSRRGIIMSLPDVRRRYGAHFLLPKVGWVRLDLNVDRFSRGPFKFDGEHYWEIGYHGTRFSDVRRAVRKAGLAIERCVRLPPHGYHCLFLLEKTERAK